MSDSQRFVPMTLHEIRARALEMAVRSLQPGGHMVDFVKRAHYFAHFIADTDRNALCTREDACDYSITLVPERRN
jgi:hypothetical protein